MKLNIRKMMSVATFAVAILGSLAQSAVAAGNFSGAIYTSLGDGTAVNHNIYPAKAAVYLNGGPQNQNGSGLPNGDYYFQVTNPNGSVLLSTDLAVCRQLQVVGGVVSNVNPADPGCRHVLGAFNPANNSTPVQLVPFDDTPNAGGEYKVHLISKNALPKCDTSIAADGKHLNYKESCTKTDNFKVASTPPPPPTCASYQFPAILEHPECFVQMPIRKTVDARPIDCTFISGAPGTTVGTVTTVVDTTTCVESPSVVGTMTKVCTTVDDSADNNPAVTNCSVTPAYLPQFTVALYSDFAPTDGLPDNFPDAICGDGPGCLGSGVVPPMYDPFFAPGVPVVGCEIDIPAGWYLPDGGVTLPNHIPTSPTVFSVGSDRNRCFAFTIPTNPVPAEFPINIDNTPTGKINISKITRFGDGTFTFITGGSTGSECDNATTSSASTACTGGGLPAEFSITTAGGVGTNNKSYIVSARTVFPNTVPLDPYSVAEKGAPTPADLANWTTVASCGGGTTGTSGTNFGLAPNGVVDCVFTNTLNHCSYTQGAWFQKPSGGNPSNTYLVPQFSTAFPSGLVVGVGNTLSFASAAAVSATKPGGQPGQLTQSYTYPPNTDFTGKGGNLASQVVALKINTTLTLQYAGIGGLKLTGLTGSTACYNGQTVSQVLATAEAVLGGAATPCGSIGDLTSLLGNGVNPSFDACRASQWSIEHLQ